MKGTKFGRKLTLTYYKTKSCLGCQVWLPPKLFLKKVLNRRRYSHTTREEVHAMPLMELNCLHK